MCGLWPLPIAQGAGASVRGAVKQGEGGMYTFQLMRVYFIKELHWHCLEVTGVEK